jgi:SanA protein
VIKRIAPYLFRLFLVLLIAGGLVIGASQLLIELYLQPRLYPAEEAPTAPVAIVFGAGLRRDGSPSPVLRSRIDTAVDLYFSGKVSKLLMSGDNRFLDYNEPGAMSDYAISLGVPPEDIVQDFAGRRTYDTCFRAKAVFEVQQAILVTQRYHLSRAVYTCGALGLEASGVSANQNQFRSPMLGYWRMREVLATVVALWELWVTHPVPVLGTPEPIIGSLQLTAHV